jgi:hypothetical protein
VGKEEGEFESQSHLNWQQQVKPPPQYIRPYSQMMLASGLWGTRGPAAGGPANNAMIAQMNGYVEMRECHNCHQVGHLARNCPKGSTPAAGAATAKKSGNFKQKTKSGGTRRGRNRELIRVLMAMFKRSRLMPLGNLNLVMGSNTGRETDGAGNHVSGCPAQNPSNTGKKEPRPTLPLKNSRCPLFLSTCIFCR